MDKEIRDNNEESYFGKTVKLPEEEIESLESLETNNPKEEEQEEESDAEVNQSEHNVKEVKTDWEEKKGVYRKLQETERRARQLAEENEFIKAKLNDSRDSGIDLLSRNMDNALRDAEDVLDQALASGDKKGVSQAMQQISRITRYIDEINTKKETYKGGKEENNTKEPPPNIYDLRSEQFEIWLDHNPELDYRSSGYNKKLSEVVTPFINQLDNDLINNGRASAIGTKEYFALIRNYTKRVKDENKNLGRVAPVNHLQNKKDIGVFQLSERHKKAADGLRIPYETYAERMKKHQQDAEKTARR